MQRRKNTNRPPKMIPPPKISELEKDYSSTMSFIKLSKVPKEVLSKISRVGVIPYIRFDGETYFAMGVDFTYGEITDCGGARKKEETVERTGFRELYEESARVFNFVGCEDRLRKAPILVNNDTCVFFYKIEEFAKYGFPNKLPHIFSQSQIAVSTDIHSVSKGRVFFENSLMYWISISDIEKIIEKRTRKVTQRSYHPSTVSIKTLCNVEGCSNFQCCKRYMPFHPKMYEKLRRIFYKSIRSFNDTYLVV